MVDTRCFGSKVFQSRDGENKSESKNGKDAALGMPSIPLGEDGEANSQSFKLASILFTKQSKILFSCHFHLFL